LKGHRGIQRLPHPERGAATSDGDRDQTRPLLAANWTVRDRRSRDPQLIAVTARACDRDAQSVVSRAVAFRGPVFRTGPHPISFSDSARRRKQPSRPTDRQYMPLGTAIALRMQFGVINQAAGPAPADSVPDGDAASGDRVESVADDSAGEAGRESPPVHDTYPAGSNPRRATTIADQGKAACGSSTGALAILLVPAGSIRWSGSLK
jgi:hypothetical protein